MWLKMTTSRVRSPSAGTHNPLRVTTADVSIALTNKSDTIFATFFAPIVKKSKCTQK
jgi:hypothetical protein